jgi:alpha-tubulin suppressor-like RCC1 family protein
MGEDQADKQRPTLVTFPFFAETRESPVSADSLETQDIKKNTRNAIVDVALGGSHSCFLDSGGAVWTVGRNNHGRLGRVAHGKWTGTPGRVVFPPPRGGGEWACESIVAGGRHTLAVARAV